MLEKSLRTFEFSIEKDRWSLRAMTFTQEDLVQYANVRSEVAGRICTIVQLNELTENDFYAILNSDGISPVDRLADYYVVRLKMSAKAKRKLAKDAAENGLGVRFIRS